MLIALHHHQNTSVLTYVLIAGLFFCTAIIINRKETKIKSHHMNSYILYIV